MTHPAIEKLARAIRMEFHGRWGDEHPWEEMTDIEKAKWLRIIEIAHRLILSEPPSTDMKVAGIEGAGPREGHTPAAQGASTMRCENG